MRTNEERAVLVRKRTAEIRKERQKKKRRACDILCIASCLVLVVSIGLFMPGWAAGITCGEVHHTSVAASLMGNNAALVYILMGLLSFLLGVCVTVFLYRLHRRHEREQGEKKDHEL